MSPRFRPEDVPAGFTVMVDLVEIAPVPDENGRWWARFAAAGEPYIAPKLAHRKIFRRCGHVEFD